MNNITLHYLLLLGMKKKRHKKTITGGKVDPESSPR